MQKQIILSENEALRLVINNSKLNRAYADFVERELCKVIGTYKHHLKGLEYNLQPCGVFKNHVTYIDSGWSNVEDYRKIIYQLKGINDIGDIHIPLLERCVKLADKQSNLLYHYFHKLIEEISNQLSWLCDDFEYQLCSIDRKEIDEIPTGFLRDFLSTKHLGRGKIIINQ